MRKFKLMALAFVIGTAGLFAANTLDPDNPVPKKVIRSQIVELLKAPTFSVNQEMTVNITFTFNSEGEVVVLKVDNRNHDVLKYIRQNINHKKVDQPGERDKLYTMPIKVQKG